MKSYLSFLLTFTLLSVWTSCKEDSEYLPMDPPECPRRFPALADWNYQSLSTKDNKAVFGLYFGKMGKGIASSDDEIWKTDNDGNSWQRVYDGPVSYLDNIIFTDINNGFITGTDDHTANLLITHDEGLNWESISFPGYRYLEKISFADSLRGIGIFRNVSYDLYIAKTKNGGHSWEGIDEIPKAVTFSDFNLSASGFGYIPNDKGDIYFTHDFAETWSKIETGFKYIRAVQFLDSLTGFVSHSNGIFKTEDGGMTWDTISQTGTSVLHFFTKQDGISIQVVDHWWDYDVQATCLAFATTHDGGENWNIGEATSSGLLSDLNYVDSNLIYGITYAQDFHLVKIFR
jgi:photosystem II stability/assembly factor-like uncharacterized protein